MPYSDTLQPALPVYIVLESNALIAEDIIGSLRATGPCRVIRVERPEMLAPSLHTEPAVTAAFLEMPYRELMQSDLHQSLADSGARIILTIGEDDESVVLQQGWGMLVRPFTEQMIREALTPRRDADSH
ncbi:MAG: hypothetical protein ACX93P_11355 [Roseovarius sp.]